MGMLAGPEAYLVSWRLACGPTDGCNHPTIVLNNELALPAKGTRYQGKFSAVRMAIVWVRSYFTPMTVQRLPRNVQHSSSPSCTSNGASTSADVRSSGAFSLPMAPVSRTRPGPRCCLSRGPLCSRLRSSPFCSVHC